MNTSPNVIVCFRVTRALFALAERTKMDPNFTGESLNYTEMTSQVLWRHVGTMYLSPFLEFFKESVGFWGPDPGRITQCYIRELDAGIGEGADRRLSGKKFNSQFQDVERKTSIVSKGPPRNIYSSCNWSIPSERKNNFILNSKFFITFRLYHQLQLRNTECSKATCH